MKLSKRKALMKTIVISQFNYCPLAWLFQSRKLQKRINSIHERAFIVKYQGYHLSFFELSQKDNPVTIQQWNLKSLAT